MEKTLLLSVEDWQNWYYKKKDSWGSINYVQSLGDTDTPVKYPCIVIGCENRNEEYAFFCYDFIYKSDM